MDALFLGLSVALTTSNLLWCLAGVTLGTLVGVLPGLGPMAAISILLPLTYNIPDSIGSIIFLAGLYYGTQYGGSTTSILLNLPGETSSMVTVIDGYKMTLNGRSGAALSIAALASFVAGTVAAVLIALFAIPLADMAFKFGPTEYASLMFLGLLACVSLTQGSLLKGIVMVVVGIFLGMIGTDVTTGLTRFTFGFPELVDGISFGILAIGIFGIGEIIHNAIREKSTPMIAPSLRELYPNKEELQQSRWPIFRGTIIGSILGTLPGAGTVLSALAAYTVEKKVSPQKNQFGSGAVGGVAAPESANNAAAQTGFLPMLALGLPTTPVMSMMIAVLMINGIQPGPQVIANNPGLFWGLIASMWVGNLMLVILNLPLVGVWISILKIPRWILYPIIIVCCVFGAYSINNSWFDIGLLMLFGTAGVIFKFLEFEPAPLAMGFIIGPMFEEHLRRSIALDQWNIASLVDRPLALSFISIGILLLVGNIWWKRNKR